MLTILPYCVPAARTRSGCLIRAFQPCGIAGPVEILVMMQGVQARLFEPGKEAQNRPAIFVRNLSTQFSQLEKQTSLQLKNASERADKQVRPMGLTHYTSLRRMSFAPSHSNRLRDGLRANLKLRKERSNFPIADPSPTVATCAA